MSLNDSSIVLLEKFIKEGKLAGTKLSVDIQEKIDNKRLEIQKGKSSNNCMIGILNKILSIF
jgi:hypothetical protein